MNGGKWSTKYKKSINCRNLKDSHKNNTANMVEKIKKTTKTKKSKK